MGWVKIDDRFDEDARVKRLSDAAFRLHFHAIFWCIRHQTGLFPAYEAQSWSDGAIQELVVCQLWRPRRDGFVVGEAPAWRPDVGGEARREWGAIRRSVAPDVLRRDGNRCVRCGSRVNLTVDHIIPLGRGGSNDLSNLQTLCGPCNERKGML